jgi:hypothetical protein
VKPVTRGGSREPRGQRPSGRRAVQTLCACQNQVGASAATPLCEPARRVSGRCVAVRIDFPRRSGPATAYWVVYRRSPATGRGRGFGVNRLGRLSWRPEDAGYRSESGVSTRPEMSGRVMRWVRRMEPSRPRTVESPTRIDEEARKVELFHVKRDRVAGLTPGRSSGAEDWVLGEAADWTAESSSAFLRARHAVLPAGLAIGCTADGTK